jgi:excisionase family DNA binding protein
MLTLSAVWSRLMSSSRITVKEICRDLGLGRVRVFDMLEKNIIPNIRMGRTYLVSRYAYEEWKKTLGMSKPFASVGGLRHVS